MNLRERVLQLSLLAASCAFAGGAAEIVLRLTAAKSDPREYVAFRKSAVAELDYELVPEARLPWAGREIRTNRQGFRGPDFNEGEPRGLRIAVIGDSVAAGYGVAEQEAFPFVVAARVREQGVAAEVLDFGVPGYNLARIAALWSARVAPYRPALVIYALCLNDARPELRLSAGGVLEPAGTVELTPGRSRPGRLPLPGKEWFRRHSLLYRFTMARYDLLLRRLGLRAEPLPPVAEIERLYSGTQVAVEFASRLTNLARAVETSGGDFVVMCFPLAEQLRDRTNGPQAVLRSLATEAGFGFIDLYPSFLEAARGRPETLFDSDGLHPNSVGHAIAARELVAFLRASLGERLPWPTAATEGPGSRPFSGPRVAR